MFAQSRPTVLILLMMLCVSAWASPLDALVEAMNQAANESVSQQDRRSASEAATELLRKLDSNGMTSSVLRLLSQRDDVKSVRELRRHFEENLPQALNGRGTQGDFTSLSDTMKGLAIKCDQLRAGGDDARFFHSASDDFFVAALDRSADEFEYAGQLLKIVRRNPKGIMNNSAGLRDLLVREGQLHFEQKFNRPLSALWANLLSRSNEQFLEDGALAGLTEALEGVVDSDPNKLEIVARTDAVQHIEHLRSTIRRNLAKLQAQGVTEDSLEARALNEKSIQLAKVMSLLTAGLPPPRQPGPLRRMFCGKKFLQIVFGGEG